MIVPALALAADADFFESRVRPVLARHCYSCHTTSKMGGLALDSGEAIRAGGGRGPAIIAGDPAGSLLMRAVRHEEDKLKMPPSGKLSDAEIDDLAAWIKSGAVWPETKASVAAAPGYKITREQREWWAFQPVRKPEAPVTKDTRWPRTPIDRFILASLESQGLKPNPAADKLALLRRAYFDLAGLPPTPEQTTAFLNDKSPAAFARVVDELLASPRYGERWGRYWLDVARYSDDRLNSTQDDPYPNAWRYRDWVIGAFNAGMPYDEFLKAQIAGDQLDNKDRMIAGLGLFALSPQFQDDRVDTVSRGILGLTVACAQCHDHKFDPIPTKDYYAMLGVFTSTKLDEFPLAPQDVVDRYKKATERIEEKQKEIAGFLDRQAVELSEILAARTAAYIEAVRKDQYEESLDRETYDRWKKYLRETKREHPFLNDWEKPSFSVTAFQELALSTAAKKKEVDQTNLIRLGGSQVRRDLANADLLSLERDQFFLWRDLFSNSRFEKFETGVLYYKEGKIDRFLSGEWNRHLSALRDELDERKRALPEPYPYYHVITDNEKPANARIQIRGSRDNLGDEAPRAFLSILSKAAPAPFTQGSGRRELAEAIACRDNPLTARVWVNRVWGWHFGRPLVATPSNFGQLGEKPSHPELLDYLATQFMDNGWSLKKLHREIMLSSVYQLSAAQNDKSFARDPDNRYFWRANRRRLEIEPLRDTLLAVTGELDREAGGPPAKLTDASNLRRTVYGFVSRRKLDGTLALFDFPNPNNTSEQRIETLTPLQQLFFLNSRFVEDRALALACRLEGESPDDAARIELAYRRLYGRAPSKPELRLGLDYLASPAGTWQRYAQVLLSANELLFVN